MHQQLRYALLFLTLTLFGFTSLGYSQDPVKQSSEKPSVTEQLTEKPNPSVAQVKNLETRLGTLERRFIGLENSLDGLGGRSTNWFLISAVIFLALVILGFGVFVLGRLRKVQQGYQESDAKVQDLEKQLREVRREYQESDAKVQDLEKQLRDRMEGSQESLTVAKLQDLEKQLANGMEGLQKSLTSVQQISMDNTKKLDEVESKQSSMSKNWENTSDIIAEIKQQTDSFDSNLANLETDIKTDGTIDYQSEAETIVQETQEQVSELARAYREGAPIDFIEVKSPTPSQKVHLIARLLRRWKIELEQSGQTNLLQSLNYPEKTLKNRLKTIRGESTPAPQPLDLDTNISTDLELSGIRHQCLDYMARFVGILWGYELGREVDEAAHAQFIPQFIKDQFFNNMAKSIPFDQLPEQFDRFLQLVDYEIVSIKVGKTIADSREHEIQASQQSDVEKGTVASVVLPGLRRRTDGAIVQKPVVIRGE